VEFVRKQFPQVRVQALDRNYGFTGGNNRGVEAADTEIVILLNNDMIVDRNFLVANELIHLESGGNRHWLSRAKTTTRYSVVEKLGTDDELVVIEVDRPGEAGIGLVLVDLLGQQKGVGAHAGLKTQ
jgi:hypothetical protein